MMARDEENVHTKIIPISHTQEHDYSTFAGRTRATMMHTVLDEDHRNDHDHPPLLADGASPARSWSNKLEAIRLNDEAVDLFISGKGDTKALGILEQALRQIKAELNNDSCSSGDSPSQSRIRLCVENEHGLQSRCATSLLQILGAAPMTRLGEAGCRCCCQYDPRVAVVPLPVTRYMNKQDSSFSFYSKLFTFQQSPVDDNDGSGYHASVVINTELLSSTILYNIAFVLTMKCIQSNNSPTLFTKAMALYKLSLSLLQQTSAATISTFGKCLALVCCNNMGQLACLQGDYTNAQAMRLSLRSLLVEWLSATMLPLHHDAEEQNKTTSDTTQLLVDDADIQAFKLNIVLMYPPKTAAAA